MKNSLFAKLTGLVLIASFVLSGCGFQLRGSYLLPESVRTVHLQTFDKQADISRRLKQLLKANQVELVDNAAMDLPHIIINHDNLSRRTLSVFTNAQVAEYELIYTVNYSVVMPDADPQQFSVEVYRDYQDNPNAVLAKSKELDLMLGEMRQDAADRIVRNLAIIGT